MSSRMAHASLVPTDSRAGLIGVAGRRRQASSSVQRPLSTNFLRSSAPVTTRSAESNSSPSRFNWGISRAMLSAAGHRLVPTRPRAASRPQAAGSTARLGSPRCPPRDGEPQPHPSGTHAGRRGRKTCRRYPDKSGFQMGFDRGCRHATDPTEAGGLQARTDGPLLIDAKVTVSRGSWWLGEALGP